MNIQIFGKNKCFDTKKAERWFKERRIKYQKIDLDRVAMSPGEFESVRRAVGLDALVDPKAGRELAYLAYDEQKIDRLLDDPRLMRTPVVRNGRAATVGVRPEIWETWE